jgi:hypothetical protein
MEKISFCKTYGAKEETTFHALFECTWARCFWQDLKLVTSIKLPDFHPLTWTTNVIVGKLNFGEEACMILCGSWAVWTERNAICHGEGGWSVPQLVRWATVTRIDLSQVWKKKTVPSKRTNSSWKLPDQGTIKIINVDARFNLESNQGTSGCVIREHTCKLLNTQALCIIRDRLP